MKYCRETSLGDRLPSNAALQEGAGKSQEGCSSLRVACKWKGISWRAAFDPGLVLLLSPAKSSFSPSAWWGTTVPGSFQCCSALWTEEQWQRAVFWWRAGGRAFHRAVAGAVIWKQKSALKNQAPEREVKGVDGVQSWTEPSGKGFWIRILKWVCKSWRTGVFPGESTTIWDGTKIEIGLMWQGWQLGHMVDSSKPTVLSPHVLSPCRRGLDVSAGL